MPAASIATPCIKVCVMDEAGDLCLGCLRTLEEIAGWSALSDAERRRVLAELPARRGKVAPPPPEPR